MLMTQSLYYIFATMISIISLIYVGLIVFLYIKSDKEKRSLIMYFLLSAGMMLGIIPTLLTLLSPNHTELTSLQLMTQQSLMMIMLLFFLCIKFGLILFGIKRLNYKKSK